MCFCGYLQYWIYGKSLCFQMLPFLFDAKFGRIMSPPSNRSVVVVISPLVSLMINQVRQLCDDGVAAYILSGNTDFDRYGCLCDSQLSQGSDT